MAYSLGIDLGTTLSAAATARDGLIEIVQLGEQTATMPSIVVVRADVEVLVGDAAERESANEPSRTARGFKRRLGDPDPIVLGGKPYGAEALLAHVLRAIVARVSDGAGGPPDAIVLTHPASYDADNLTKLVRRTGRAGRIEHGEDASGTIAAAARETRVRVSVGAPIVVEGRLWGVMSARWQSEEPPPVDTEDRMARFAQLLDTAIANADSRDQLTASRARLVTEADAARRRVVRDLHDGAQQRLVHTIVSIKLATRALRGGEKDADQLMADALDHAERSNRELRELAHGILPSVLTNDGLRAGVDAVVERLDLPVSVDIPVGRFPADIEASAYFIVAEALTNVVKHADAASAEVTASVDAGMLRLRIRDDGVGGADRDGHGLVGMYDRVTALGGRLEIDSPPGGGTALTATLPIRAT